VGELDLGSGSQAAIENGQQGILPHGEALVSLGDVLVDDLDEVQLLGNRIEGGGCSELEMERVSGNGSGGLIEEFVDVLGLAQVALFDVAGASIYPGGLDQLVVVVAANGLLDDGAGGVYTAGVQDAKMEILRNSDQ